jgi:hypothetical protein
MSAKLLGLLPQSGGVFFKYLEMDQMRNDAAIFIFLYFGQFERPMASGLIQIAHEVTPERAFERRVCVWGSSYKLKFAAAHNSQCIRERSLACNFVKKIVLFGL